MTRTTRASRTALLARTCLGTALLVLSAQTAHAQALTPGTGNVGSGTVLTPGTVAGVTAGGSGATTFNNNVANTSTVTTGNSRTIINWSGFDIGLSETLNFVVGSRSDIILNRLPSGTANVDGRINAYVGAVGGAYGGNVWISSRGGAVFSGTSVVNVGGLLATTGQIADSDFFGSNYHFSAAPAGSQIATHPGAALNVHGGTLALIAPSVSSGATITDQSTGKDSDVLFGAASEYTISFAPDADGDLDLLSWTVPSSAVGSSSVTPISIAGTTSAGNIYVAAVNSTAVTRMIDVSGSLIATGATASGDGDIVLTGGGGISAGAPTAPFGGDFDLQTGAITANRHVNLSANGLVNVTGALDVGGDYTISAGDFTGNAFNPNFGSGTTNDFTIIDRVGSLPVGFRSAPGTLTVITLSGSLMINGPLSSTNENVILSATGGDLTLSGNVTTGTAAGRAVVLSAIGDVTQTSGVVTTNALRGSAGGQFSLAGANQLTALGDGTGGLTAAAGLTVNDAAGGLSVNAAVNGGTGGVALTTAGTLQVSSGVAVRATGGTISLTGASAAFTGATIANTGGGVTVNGPSSWTGTSTVSTSTGANATFAGTVNGAGNLTVTSSGTTTFQAAVGGSTALGSLTVNGGGTTTAANVTTTGAQSYNNLLLGANTSLTSGSTINVGGSTDGAYALNISGASVQLGGAVNIASLGVTGNATLSGGSVTTSASQSYGAVVLGADTVLSGAMVGFSNISGSGHDLTLDSSGGVTIIGTSLLGVRNLATTGAGSTFIAGAVNTTGTQTFGAPMSLGGNTVLSSAGSGAAGAIGVGAVTGNGFDLTLSTAGAVNFGGAGNGLSSLDATGGSVSVNGGLSAGTVALTGSNGNVAVNQSVSATGMAAITANGAGAITGTGLITGANVSLSGAGGVGTSGARVRTSATTLAASAGSSAGVYVDESNGVILGTVGSIGNGAGTRYDVRAGGTITVSAPITVSNGVAALTTTAGDIALSSASSDITAIGSSGEIRLAAAGNVSAAAGAVLTTQDIYLTAQDWTGSILSAATLQETRDISLTDTLGGLSIGGLSGQRNLAVVAQNGGLGVTGPLDAAGTLALTTTGTGNAISLGGTLTTTGASQLVSLTSAGAITQSAGGITTQNLSLSAAGAADLGQVAPNNNVANLATVSTGGAFSYRDVDGFAVGGPLTSAGAVTLIAESGNLTLAGNLNAAGQQVQLNASSGALTQTGGVITAAGLSGFVSLVASLDGANQIGVLNGLTANSLSLTNVGALTIAGANGSGTGGQDTTLRISGGALTIASGGSITGRNVALSTDGAFVNLGGASAVQSNAAGHWVIYSAAPGANSFGGLDSGNTAVWNATIGSRAPSSITGSRYVFAFQPTVTLSPTSVGKVYGTDLTGTANTYYTVSGLQSGVAGAYRGDTAATAFTGAPVISSAGFAERAAVAGSPYAMTIAPGSLAGANGYAVTASGTAQLSVTPKPITGTASANTKTYDGTTAASGAITLSGVLAGDAVGANASFAFADRNAGAGKTVNVSGASLSGADAGNYALSVPASVLADILQKALTGAAAANAKTYDGTTVATGTVTLSGVISGDSVTAGASFAFADKNAGTGKTVNVTGATLSGADAGNYTLTLPASTLAAVLQKAITGTVAANGKTYDGTTAATGNVTLTGVVAGDNVAGGATFAFTDRNAGVGKTVNVTGATLSGSDAGNYTLTLPASTLADIVQKAITGSVAVNGKTYDGTTAATGTVTLSGVVAGDTVNGGATFAFADKNAGIGKTVNVTGATLSGSDAGNYTLTLPASAVANILRKAITGTVAANGKTYDGTTAATGTVTLAGLVSGDAVDASASFAFADRNAGVGKTVNVTGAMLSGADAGNYTLTLPASTLADILKKALAGTVAANSKTYDGTTAATGSVTLTGVVAGDNVAGGATFAFADKNAGTGKTVHVTGATLGGADAGNYTLTLPASTLADILKKALTGTVAANSKTYDGTTAATGSVTLSGVVAGDSVTGGATFAFADRNAGAGKTVTVSGASLSGADAGNYSVTLPGSALADILRRAITVSANDAAKQSGEADPVLTVSVTAGSLVAGDALTGAPSRDAGEAAGNYAIRQGTVSAGGNYDLTFVPGTFTISLTAESSEVLQEFLKLVSPELPIAEPEDTVINVDDDRRSCVGDDQGSDCPN